MISSHLLKSIGLVGVFCLGLYSLSFASGNNSSTGRICNTQNHQGQLVPLVELNEVKINASGVYSPEKDPIVKPHPNPPAGFKVGVVFHDGQYIPSVRGREIEVSADLPEHLAVKQTAARSGFQGRMTVRQTFDLLLVVVTEKVITLVKHLLPGVNSHD